jgi:hypothetical protein
MIKHTLATLLAAAYLVLLPANAQSSDVVVRITGGSTGKFVATPHSLTTSGYTDFAVNVKLYRDGTASGEFICAIPNFVVLGGIANHWHRTADGRIKVTGMEYGYDAVAGAGYADCPFYVVFREGGPGEGGFDFSDCVFGPGQFDTEVVLFGRINIRGNDNDNDNN